MCIASSQFYLCDYHQIDKNNAVHFSPTPDLQAPPYTHLSPKHSECSEESMFAQVYVH